MPISPTPATRWARRCSAPPAPCTRDFTAIAVCGGKDGVISGLFPPCGVCRQVMREFCRDDFLIYLITPSGYETRTLAQLLPDSFSNADMN